MLMMAESETLVQALGIALKLTLQGQNQFIYPETYYCIVVGLLGSILFDLSTR